MCSGRATAYAPLQLAQHGFVACTRFQDAHQVESLLVMPWLELRVSLPSLRASHSQNRTPCSAPPTATDWFSACKVGSNVGQPQARNSFRRRVGNRRLASIPDCSKGSARQKCTNLHILISAWFCSEC